MVQSTALPPPQIVSIKSHNTEPFITALIADSALMIIFISSLCSKFGFRSRDIIQLKCGSDIFGFSEIGGSEEVICLGGTELLLHIRIDISTLETLYRIELRPGSISQRKDFIFRRITVFYPTFSNSGYWPRINKEL